MIPILVHQFDDAVRLGGFISGVLLVSAHHINPRVPYLVIVAHGSKKCFDIGIDFEVRIVSAAEQDTGKV